MQYIAHYNSPLGGMTLTSDGEALTGLLFDGEKYMDEVLAGAETETSSIDDPAFEEVRHWLDIYFDGRDPGFIPRLDARGTEFRKAVWEILLEIPYGKTTTYGKIADELAARQGRTRMSAQAVGGAVGHNPISLIIPCHRVIGADGSLTGYAGGIDKKRKLLELEGCTFADRQILP